MVREQKVWLLRYLAKTACGSAISVSKTSGCAPTRSRKTEVLPIPSPICVQFSMTQ